MPFVGIFCQKLFVIFNLCTGVSLGSGHGRQPLASPSARRKQARSNSPASSGKVHNSPSAQRNREINGTRGKQKKRVTKGAVSRNLQKANSESGHKLNGTKINIDLPR